MEFTPEQIEFLKGTEGQELLKANGALPAVNIENLVETEEGLKTVLNNSKVASELDKRNSKSFENFKNNTLANYVEKTKLEEIETSYKNQLNSVKIDTSIDKALAGAKYPDLIASKIDKTKLSITETGVAGLNEQLEALKANYADLFLVTPTKPTPTPPSPTPNNPEDEKEKLNKELDKIFGLK